MQIELTLGNGRTILLPKTIAIDGYTVKKDIPGTTLPGKDGQIAFKSLQRLEPVTLRASGTIKCKTKEEADRFAAILRSELINDGVVKLKRYKEADRYINVQCTEIDTDPHRGHYKASLFTLTIVFRADDPFWYSTNYNRFTEDVSFTPPVTIRHVENKGGESVNPMIWIYGKTSGGKHTKNPKIINYSTGLRLEYEGEIKEGELLVFDTEKRKALFVGNNVLQAGTARSGTSGGIQLSTSASDVDNFYNDQIVKITSGTGSGQYKKIIGYNGSTKVAFVDAPWEVSPNTSSKYEIYHFSWAEGYQLYEAQTYSGNGGVSVTEKVNDGYQIDGFYLRAGYNQIEFECENELLDIEILFKERWS